MDSQEVSFVALFLVMKGIKTKYVIQDTVFCTWLETTLVGESLPQPHYIILPADHLSQDQHHRDGGETHQQEQRVSSLHHKQPLLMSHNLQVIMERGEDPTRCTTLWLYILTVICKISSVDLHDSHSSICDSWPVDSPNHHPDSSKGTGPWQSFVYLLQEIHQRAWGGQETTQVT